jgi:hypothetical protein
VKYLKSKYKAWPIPDESPVCEGFEGKCKALSSPDKNLYVKDLKSKYKAWPTPTRVPYVKDLKVSVKH